MKLIPSGPGPDQVPTHLGAANVRATPHGYVVQQTPPNPIAFRSPLARQMTVRFGFAGRMASNPSDTQLETAMEMAKGTEQVPRDILTMAALGRYYIFETDAGGTWRHVRTPTVTDPMAYRASAVYLQRPSLPWQGLYLVIAPGYRLIL